MDHFNRVLLRSVEAGRLHGRGDASLPNLAGPGRSIHLQTQGTFCCASRGTFRLAMAFADVSG